MGKRGAQPIAMPEDFKTAYIKAKDANIRDVEIAQEHFVSVDTLQRWKKRVGFKPGDFAANKIRRPKSSPMA